jgi:hypothetical protein
LFARKKTSEKNSVIENFVGKEGGRKPVIPGKLALGKKPWVYSTFVYSR